MRNLKKVMALALATVMLFGMMVMGAGAADYTDADQIDTAKYGTAVELLNAIGAFQGNADGSLNPKGTLTRAEAAVSVAKLALTKDIASKLGAAATNFADVDDSYAWASGAIAWAETLNIVSGYNGNYDPAGTLTGYQYAKMLLVVLGYDPAVEGYTGTTWASNVNLDAIQAGLLDGLNIDMGEAILREQAIQMVYNALLADVVEYKTAGSVITLPDGTTISSAGSGAEAEKTDKESYKGDDKDNTLQLIEKLYDEYTLDTEDADKYGYALKTWSNKAGKVVSENNFAVKATFADLGKVTYTDLYKATGTVKADIKIYKNGVDTEVVALKDKINAKTNTDKALASFVGGAAELVSNNGTLQIFVKMPELATVTSVKGTKTTIEVGAATAELTTDAYAEEATIQVYVKEVKDGKATVLDHAAITPVVGTLTATKTNADGKVTAIVVDGVTYTLQAAGAYKEDLMGGKVDAYVANGYVLQYVKHNTTTTPGNPDLAKVYYFAALSKTVTDGWNSEYKIAKLYSLADYEFIDQNVSAAVTFEAGLYTIEDELKDDGKTKTGYKTLKAYEGDKNFGVEEVNKALTATAKSITFGEDGKAYFTANSVILDVTKQNTKDVAIEKTPAPAALDAKAAILVYAKNVSKDAEGNDVDKADEVVAMIYVGAKATVSPNEKLYYVIEGDVGTAVIVKADGTKVFYDVVTLIDIAAGAKIEGAYVAQGTNAKGFKYATVADNVYTIAETATKEVAYKAGTEVELYNNLLTIADGKEVADKDISGVAFINANGAKDANKKAITSFAGLIDKNGEALYDFALIYNTAKALTTIVVTGK